MDIDHLSIDIATCVSNSTQGLVRLYCLDDNNLNYCCKVNNASNILNDSGEKKCCSYEDYADQQWVTLASIRGFSLLLAVLFAYFLVVVVWFYLTTFNIKQADVDATRRKVIRHLLKKQILHKSKLKPEPSLVSSVRQLSKTLSNTNSSTKSSKATKRLSDSKGTLKNINHTKSDESNTTKKIITNTKSPLKSILKLHHKTTTTNKPSNKFKPVKFIRRSPNEKFIKSPDRILIKKPINSPLKARKSRSLGPLDSGKTINTNIISGSGFSTTNFNDKNKENKIVNNNVGFKSPKSPNKKDKIKQL